MINSVVLVGRLTRDLDLRRTQTGRSVLSFNLAVKRNFTTQGQPDTDFINCVAWGKTAEVMAQYLRKGSLIGVEGRITTRNYENQQGQRVYVTEVTCDNFSFLESRNASQNYSGGYSQPYQDQPYNNNSYNQGYQQPNYNNSNQGFNGQNQANPYSSQMNTGLDAAFDDDDETFDIDTDDLPF